MGRIRDMKTGEPVEEVRRVNLPIDEDMTPPPGGVWRPEEPPVAVAPVPAWNQVPPPRPVMPENRVVTEGREVAPIAKVSNVVLPADFEEGLHELEMTLARLADASAKIADNVELAESQIKGLRARAQADAERLAALDAIEKALKR